VEASVTQEGVILNRLCELQSTNFEVTDVKVTQDKIVWQIEHKEDVCFECPVCASKHTTYFDCQWIELIDVPIGNRKSIWRIKRMRILCTCWNMPRVEKMRFRSRHHRLTQRMEDYIEQLLCTKMFTVADVARLFNVDYGVVYKIDHDVLRRLFQEMQLKDPIHIAVDEKSFRKGHKYVTIVVDLDTKKVIWVSEGRGRESLDIFFKVLGAERCSRIKTVAKDLHPAYAGSCNEYVPQAVQVADRFHIIQKLNETIDQCRQELDLKKQGFKTKNSMWLVRFKQENLPSRYYRELQLLEKKNQPLYQAYLLKESFYELYNFADLEIRHAENFLIRWCVDAFKTGLQSLKEFAEFIDRHRDVILASIKTDKTSAICEGINSKISVIKKMAYGYINIQYFMLKILQRCGSLGQNWRSAAL
jgi:transposase